MGKGHSGKGNGGGESGGARAVAPRTNRTRGGVL